MPASNALIISGLPRITAITLPGISLTETTCQDSYPLNSENASPPGTFTVYLSGAAIAKPPRTANKLETAAIVTIVLLFIVSTSVDELIIFQLRPGELSGANGVQLHGINRMKLVLAAASAVFLFGQAQSPPARAGFEVASVKQNTGSEGRSLLQAVQGRLIMTNLALRRLILIAYDLQDYQLSGAPAWADSE